MATYSDIQELHEAGQTAEQIKANLDANPLTVRDIPVNVLRPLLFVEWGLVNVDPVTKQRSGPLIDLYVSDQTPKELKAVIEKLFAHLDDPTAEYVRTESNKEWASAWHAVVAMLALSDEQLAVLDSLHGGRKFAGVTVEQIQGLIDARGAETAKEANRLALGPIETLAREGWNAFAAALDAGEIAVDASWSAVRDQFWPVSE